jgi:molybdenum cofactor biosynthesis enzyme MoaA
MEMTLEITDKCPLRCIHCSSSPKRGELSFDEIKETIDRYPIIESVVLSGGEPLMHPEVEAIIEWLLEKDLQLMLYTSGYVEASAAFLAQFDLVFTSLYGTARFHNFITRESSWDRTIETVKKTRRNGCVSSPVFGQDTRKIIDVVRNWRVPIHLTRLLPHGKASHIPVKPRAQQLAIALEMAREYPKVIISESLLHDHCNWESKLTVLGDGRVVNCVAGKWKNGRNGTFVCDKI